MKLTIVRWASRRLPSDHAHDLGEKHLVFRLVDKRVLVSRGAEQMITRLYDTSGCARLGIGHRGLRLSTMGHSSDGFGRLHSNLSARGMEAWTDGARHQGKRSGEQTSHRRAGVAQHDKRTRVHIALRATLLCTPHSRNGQAKEKVFLLREDIGNVIFRWENAFFGVAMDFFNLLHSQFYWQATRL